MSSDLFYLATTLLVLVVFTLLGLLATALLLKEFRGNGSVNSRAPGLSDHASPIRQTEARAERTIERPPDKNSLRTGAGETLHLPSSRAPGGKGGMTRAKPLVLTEDQALPDTD